MDLAIDTVKRYETTLMHFKQFIHSKYNRLDMNFEELNPQFIRQFEMYFKLERNCSHNTTIKYLKNFKKIVLIALDNGWIQKNPFTGIKFKLTQVDKVYLTQEELESIQHKKITIERLERVRDIFLFCCFTGMAISDVKSLKQEHIDVDKDGVFWIKKKRIKTGQLSTIFLLDEAKRILNKYEFHPLVQDKDILLPVPSGQKMNAYLKELADICNIKKNVTTHSGRHTYATTVTLENGIPLEVVSRQLGHSNTRMTQRYARTTEKLIMENMKRIAGKY